MGVDSRSLLTISTSPTVESSPLVSHAAQPHPPSEQPTTGAIARPQPARRRLFAGGSLLVLGPASLSLLWHAVIIVPLAVVSWDIRKDAPTEYTASVVAKYEDVESSGGFHFPGGANVDRPDSPKEGSSISDLASLLAKDNALQISPVDSSASELSALSVKELSRSDVVGAGVNRSAGTDGALGERDLASGGPVGSLWGVGKGQKARSIVYVLDRSGSMGDTFGRLQRELMRAIGSLEPDQEFNVIWFNEGPATEWSHRMRRATLENKRDAFSKLKRIFPDGNTEPRDAIRKGLGYEPDVLFLLSDGDFGEENQRIIRLIADKNREKRTIINTILFVYDTMGDGERVLRRIAEMNRGTYKHVTEEDTLRR